MKLFTSKQPKSNNILATRLRTGMSIKIQLDDNSIILGDATQVRTNDEFVLFDLVANGIDQCVALYMNDYIETSDMDWPI